MRYHKLILVFVTSFLFSSCASVKPTVYHPEKIKQIKKWAIDLKYQPGEIERKSENTGESEIKVTTGGQTSRDLQLKDDVTFFLQDNFQVNIIQSSENTDEKY